MQKNTKVLDLPQGTPEWLSFRQGKIGASDIPSIAEIEGAYKKRVDVLNEKLGLVNDQTSDYQKQLFQSGHEWEKVVVDYLNADEVVFKPAVVQLIDQPLFFASLDGINDSGDTVLEIKSTKRTEFLESVEAGVLPKIWEAQMNWQMYITGASKGLLACVNSVTGAVRTCEIKRDDNLIQYLTDAATAFLVDLQSGVRPYQQLETAEMQKIAAIKLMIKEIEYKVEVLDAEYREIAKNLLTQYKATKIEGCGIVIEWVEKVGNVDYSKIEVLKGIDLDAYRKPASRYVKITEAKKQKKENTNEQLSDN